VSGNPALGPVNTRKLAPVPKGYERGTKPFFVVQPRPWNHQSLRPPPRLAWFSLVTLFDLIVLTGPKLCQLLEIDRPARRCIQFFERSVALAFALSQQLTIPERTQRQESSDQPSQPADRRWRIRSFLAATFLTPLVVLIHGYHPLADDGAIYVAGIKKLVHPNLYQPDAVFVTSHVRFSIFAHVLAGVVRDLHVPLPILLLICHLASIFLFLLGASKVSERLFAAPAERWGAVLLVACCFTLPVAGTSLFLMDPYVTARSFATPLALFALAAILGDAWGRAALWLTLGALLHPLMTGFTAVFLLAVVFARRRMWRALAAFAGLGLLTCFALFMVTLGVPPGLASSQAALSRSYFFLSTWQWYEYPGLICPLLLFAATARHMRGRGNIGSISVASTVVGSCALIVALCFVHRSGSFLLARIQVLRAFHMIYLIGTLLVGGLLGRLAQVRPWIAAATYATVLTIMFAGQRLTYPASDPVEWPGFKHRNAWQQAFLWIRSSTPENAVFALDADYIESAGEDAQGFRATAERSSIADWYKDGGVASMFPAAQELWWDQVRLTERLNQASDAERRARLLPAGATWIILPVGITTALRCPYVNNTVRICQLGVR
jgi:hypothetical protein